MQSSSAALGTTFADLHSIQAAQSYDDAQNLDLYFQWLDIFYFFIYIILHITI